MLKIYMAEFFKSKKFKFLAAVLAVLFSGTVLAAVSHNGTSPFSSVLGIVFSPIQRLSSLVSEKMTDFSVNFRSASVYSDKVDELEKIIEDYQLKLIDYEQTRQKLSLYEEFLELKEENSDYEFAPASVIAKDSVDMFYSFVINKGSAHGVEVNDPVIYGKYLVGVVHSVKPTTSVVHTILDPKVNVSAYDVQSREFGYVTTTSELALKQECYLPGLERNTAITKGSVICTTGIGGIYPKDLIIGTVEDVLNDPHNVSAYALIKTGVIIPDLQDVFVITSFDGQGISSDNVEKAD